MTQATRRFVVIDTGRMFAQAGRKPAGTSRSLSHDAAAADAARAPAAISRPPTHQSASFSPERCRPYRAKRAFYAGHGEGDGSFLWRREIMKKGCRCCRSRRRISSTGFTSP